MGCGTFQLNDKVKGLVEKLIGVKKVFTEETVVQKIEKDKTKGMFLTVGDRGTILTSSNSIIPVHSQIESLSAVPLVPLTCQSVHQTSSERISDPTDYIQFGGS